MGRRALRRIGTEEEEEGEDEEEEEGMRENRAQCWLQDEAIKRSFGEERKRLTVQKIYRPHC